MDILKKYISEMAEGKKLFTTVVVSDINCKLIEIAIEQLIDTSVMKAENTMLELTKNFNVIADEIHNMRMDRVSNGSSVDVFNISRSSPFHTAKFESIDIFVDYSDKLSKVKVVKCKELDLTHDLAEVLNLVIDAISMVFYEPKGN